MVYLFFSKGAFVTKVLSSAWFLLALIVLIWGLSWPIMKIGLAYIDPLWFTVARLTVALIAISCLLIFLGRFKRPHKEDLPIVFGVGVMQFAGFVSMINLGLMEVNAGRAALLAYTTPLWVAPVAHFFLKQKLSINKVLGVAVGLCGLMILFNPMAFDWSNWQVVKGNGLLLMAALIWALSILHVGQHKWRGSVLELAPWQIIVALCITIPLAWFADTKPITWNQELILVILYNGVLASALAQWASIRVTQLLPAVTVSLGFLMVPLAGIFFSSIWLKEPFTLTLAIGSVLILLGLLLQLNWKKS
mgnify:FL=1